MKIILFILANWTWFLFGLIALIAFEVGLYEYGYSEGKGDCTNKTAGHQLQTNLDNGKKDAKIDKATPYNADNDSKLGWLLGQSVR